MHMITIFGQNIPRRPGVENYTVYQELSKPGDHGQHFLLRNQKGNELVGIGKPGYTAFVDWFAEGFAAKYAEFVDNYHGLVKFSGVLFDMFSDLNYCDDDCLPSQIFTDPVEERL